MYTRVAETEKPTRVETQKGSKRVLRRILKFIATIGVTRERVDHGSNNA